MPHFDWFIIAANQNSPPPPKPEDSLVYLTETVNSLVLDMYALQGFRGLSPLLHFKQYVQLSFVTYILFEYKLAVIHNGCVLRTVLYSSGSQTGVLVSFVTL